MTKDFLCWIPEKTKGLCGICGKRTAYINLTTSCPRRVLKCELIITVRNVGPFCAILLESERMFRVCAQPSFLHLLLLFSFTVTVLLTGNGAVHEHAEPQPRAS